jgi:hypothetical protein
MESSSSSAGPGAASASLPDPDDGFVLSLDDPNHPTNFTKPSVDKKGKAQPQESQYILGTLIVRVVAARGLEVPAFGGVFRSNPNPYASVKFGSSTQRSSEVFDTLDPVWPRHETMFMDVSVPATQLTHPELEDNPHSENSTSESSGNNHSENEDPYHRYKKPNTILTVAIFHTPEIGRAHKFRGYVSGDSDDMFLGVASVDLSRLFTGKISTLDRWLPLQGTSQDSTGSVRIVCEYEPSDIPPKPGDICRFTTFSHPKDLYPLEPGRPYKVDQVHGDIVLLSYQSQEGWVLSFQAHKNMLICEERHVSALNSAQDELQTLGERLAYSPLVAHVAQGCDRVVDDGLVGVAEVIAKGGVSLLDRWLKGGIDTVISDIQDVANLDGRHNPDTRERLELSSPMSFPASTPGDNMDAEEQEEEEIAFMDDEDGEEALYGMPPCPITGFPMVEPVVAADGHTYEKSAIARWLRTSEKSPMTGQALLHKQLVPNYGLMSSVQEAAAERKAALAASRVKKPTITNSCSDSIMNETVNDNQISKYAKKPPPSLEIEDEDGEEDDGDAPPANTSLKSEKL